ncbi:MAG TPA: prepilin-type N-terminal cleavage/methylation domain-containing protein [Dissulfurispiraceae bacterium]
MRKGGEEGFYKHFFSHSGFTLLELMVVMVLITLIAGLSTVFFAGTASKKRLEAEAVGIFTTMRHARALSQMNGEGYAVAINLDSKEYGIEGGRSRKLPSDIGMKVIDPAGGERHNGEYRFEFLASGGVQGGTVVLENGKREIKIEPDPIVGAVMIKQQ